MLFASAFERQWQNDGLHPEYALIKLIQEKVDDQNSFDVARRLIKEEGLLCGGSSGTVVWAAFQAAKDLNANQKCLCILADGIRNYMGKFVSDKWMKEKGFNI